MAARSSCFTDYMRPAIRLAALMRQRVIHVLTHDSIGLGEDGPTHQPVEHLASLRAMPNVHVLPPGRRDGDRRMLGAGAAPRRRPEPAGAVAPGAAGAAHRCRREPLRPRRLRAGRGRRARAGHADRHRHRRCRSPWPRATTLAAEGIQVAVVSLPCWELFAAQDEAYRAERARRRAARRHRGGGGVRLGALAGPGRRVHRHDRLRRLARPPTISTGISASPPTPLPRRVRKRLG